MILKLLFCPSFLKKTQFSMSHSWNVMENLCEEVSSKFKISDLFLKIILRTMRNRTLFPGCKNCHFTQFLISLLSFSWHTAKEPSYVSKQVNHPSPTNHIGNTLDLKKMRFQESPRTSSHANANFFFKKSKKI